MNNHPVVWKINICRPTVVCRMYAYVWRQKAEHQYSSRTTQSSNSIIPFIHPHTEQEQQNSAAESVVTTRWAEQRAKQLRLVAFTIYKQQHRSTAPTTAVVRRSCRLCVWRRPHRRLHLAHSYNIPIHIQISLPQQNAGECLGAVVSEWVCVWVLCQVSGSRVLWTVRFPYPFFV